MISGGGGRRAGGGGGSGEWRRRGRGLRGGVVRGRGPRSALSGKDVWPDRAAVRRVRTEGETRCRGQTFDLTKLLLEE